MNNGPVEGKRFGFFLFLSSFYLFIFGTRPGLGYQAKQASEKEYPPASTRDTVSPKNIAQKSTRPAVRATART